jgi:hypothetical protein
MINIPVFFNRAFIEVGIYDTEQYERSDFFYIELQPPIWSKKMSGQFPLFDLAFLTCSV